MKKKLLSVLLTFCMVLSLLPVTALAEEPAGTGSTQSAPPAEFKSGEYVSQSDLEWYISSGESLTVTGDNGEKLVFDTEALKGIDSQISGPFKADIEDISAEYQNGHPGKKVFYLTVSSGDKTIANFGGKVTITLPYELNDGETAGNVTVWYLTNSGITIEIPSSYDLETKLVTFEVTHFSLYMTGVDTWANPFEDVSENDWFYKEVKFAKQNNLFVGTGSTTFSPARPMTREMLWTVLGRVDGGEKLYGDGVYEAAREWAMAAGLTDGTNPGKSITREQIVIILWRYAKYKDYDVSFGEDTNILSYNDALSISEYAFPAMQWACGAGIIKGYNGNLMPKDNATRAEVAAILQRFIERQ